MLPLLSSLIFVPVAAMVAVMLTPKGETQRVRLIATAACAVVFLVSAWVFFRYDGVAGGMQFVESISWIPQINVRYYLGVDGISVPMIFITGLLSLLACVASFGIQERVKEYFALYLLLVAGMLGTFVALDLFLFYVFWEIVLVPMYFLIGVWGGPRKEYAAIKFFIYTLAGSLFMLLGILALYFASDPHTFNILELTGGKGFGLLFQKVIFLALFLGFAIKVPIWPFHTWLPDAHVEAPTPISVILAGVLLKMGTYGFLRISYPILPEAARWFGIYLAVLAAIGIVYGGFVALAQTDFKKMVAYSSVSHMGFVILGLAVFSYSGFDGALLQMFNHGTITGGLFLLVGVLYDRAHTRDLNSFGGLGARIPVYAGMLTVFSLASLGLPGLSGFVSEFLCLLGAFPVYRWITILSCAGIILGASYLLYMIQRVLLGPLNPKWKEMEEINGRELFTLIPLLVLIIFLGIFPQTILNLFGPTTHALVDSLGGLAR
ncbi:MAG: NADH-quinone oxidoreductase subunit M [Candidatus Omnitrophica bacterium]|nr:NADH-quinone oxidoreductase subunit M [Candidatus Omnitrophota bacterium]